MMTKKLSIQTLSFLSVTAMLTACSGSQSKYEAGSSTGQQQVAANQTQGQQTNDLTPVAPFDPSQGRQVTPTHTEQREEDVASDQKDECKVNYGVMKYKRIGRENMRYTLSISKSQKLVSIQVAEYDYDTYNQTILLTSSEKALLEGVRKLLASELEVENGQFDFSNPVASIAIDLTGAANGCGRHYAQPVVTTAGYENLLEDLRQYILSKLNIRKPQPRTERKTDYTTDPTTQPSKPTESKPTETKPSVTQPTTEKPTDSNKKPVALNCADLDLSGKWQYSRRYFVGTTEVFGQAENLVNVEYKLEKSDDKIVSYSANRSSGAESETLSLVLSKESCTVLQTDSKNVTTSYKVTSISKNGEQLSVETSMCTGVDCQELKKNEDGTNVTVVQTKQ